MHNFHRNYFSQSWCAYYTRTDQAANFSDGVGDSKNVIVFDPLLTGHVIWRMRSGRVCIFNADQWEPL